VWDIPYFLWVQYAAATDAYLDALKERST